MGYKLEETQCPSCGASLQTGYLFGHPLAGIRWSDKEKIYFMWQGERLPNSFWKKPIFKAARCQKCEIVIFNYKKD